MNRVTAVALTLIVTMATLSVAATGAGASAASPSQQMADANSESSAYAGTYVAFNTSGNALTDYRVNNEAVFENVRVTAQSDHQSRAGLGANVRLSAVTNISGAGLELGAQSQTRAEVKTDGSASITAHDTERGILTVDAGEESQYVEVTLADDNNTEAHTEGDRVVVESDDRTGVFVVAGNGTVTVNDKGDVVADLKSGSTLAFRSYENGERNSDEKSQEQLISEGIATAEVYVDERNGKRVADVATYGQGVAVKTHNQSKERLEMTAKRTQSEGTVIITTISEGAIKGLESADDLAVTIDGKAAAEASSYSELKGGIGEQPRYMVRQSSEATATADVLIAVDHFSERKITIQGNNSSESNTSGSGDSIPGFGAAAALISLLVATATRLQQ